MSKRAEELKELVADLKHLVRDCTVQELLDAGIGITKVEGGLTSELAKFGMTVPTTITTRIVFSYDDPPAETQGG